MNAPGSVALTPFFLPGVAGNLFALYVAPDDGHPVERGVIVCPPFAEEMNKSRRMIMLQSRRLAARGYGVLIVDLFGTGDSEGDFADARWDIWQQDLVRGADWLRERGAGELSVLGVRLGGALAIDLLSRIEPRPPRVVLWQPVVSGATFVAQFLRMRLVSAVMAGGAQGSVKALREELARAGTLEVAGYELAGTLAASVDSVDLSRAPPAPDLDLHWLELSGTGTGPGPASRRVLEAWTQAGCRVQSECLRGEPFWQTPETATVPALLQRTDACFPAFVPCPP